MSRPPRRPAARPLGELVFDIVDPVLRRKAGMTIGLLSAWPEIAGPRLASVSRPERLVWPALRPGQEVLDPAVLIVACEGASALRLQHEAGELTQRVNGFFGYRAVGRLKIVQRAVAPDAPSRKPVLRPIEAGEAERVRALTAGIADDRLRAALEAYAESLLQRRPAPKA